MSMTALINSGPKWWSVNEAERDSLAPSNFAPQDR
jgi:hypothetical protein